MSETKWTPGPWDQIVKMEGHTAVGANTLLARVFSTALCDHENETANAHLIAAAPDLYDALEEVERKFSGHYPYTVSDPGWVRIREILARARGEA